jgi:hypothetical protein
MSSIIMLKASSFRPKSICSPPMESQLTEVSETLNLKTVGVDEQQASSQSPMTIAPMEMRLLTSFAPQRKKRDHRR